MLLFGVLSGVIDIWLNWIWFDLENQTMHARILLICRIRQMVKWANAELFYFSWFDGRAWRGAVSLLHFNLPSHIEFQHYLLNFYYIHLLSISRKSQIFWSKLLSFWCAVYFRFVLFFCRIWKMLIFRLRIWFSQLKCLATCFLFEHWKITAFFLSNIFAWWFFLFVRWNWKPHAESSRGGCNLHDTL